jgi:hypothetical protein
MIFMNLIKLHQKRLMVGLINELYQNEYDSDFGFSPHTVKE